MSEHLNRRIILAARPIGYPKESDFRLVEESVPEPRDGQVLIRSLWLSLDPYMRGRMRDAPSYAAPVQIGEVMTGGVVGRVVISRNDDYEAGDIVEGRIGWQDYAVSSGSNIRKVDETLAPISTAVGVLGMPGLTAYFGLLDIGRPEPGDTVVISAASGAVGAIVGQLAKMAGCYVVGIAGSDLKVGYIRGELGFDATINYKTENVRTRLVDLCPGGINVYFDNVGGDITDAVLENIADFARIVVCGQISQYNAETPELGPRNMGVLVRHQARVEGFLVGQFAHRYQEARVRMGTWVENGSLKYKEDIVEGLENAPKAFIGMMSGANFGKLLVKMGTE